MTKGSETFYGRDTGLTPQAVVKINIFWKKKGPFDTKE